MYLHVYKTGGENNGKQSYMELYKEYIGYTLPERREQVFVRVCCSGSALALTRQTSAVPAARSRVCRLRGTSIFTLLISLLVF